jgi:AcrR family transcriptional regulator
MSGHSAEQRTVVKRRPYQAPLRAAKAAETRRRIVAAAQALFVQRGYVATTIDDVAERAGVSRPTVFNSVGGKPELLKLARDMALSGDDAPVAVPRRPMFEEVWAEPDAVRTLQLYARNMRVIHGRAAEIEQVLQSAAQTDAELDDLARTALEQRRYGCRLVAESVASKAPLRAGMRIRQAGDVIYVTASPESFRLLTTVCGWSARRYETWLAETLALQLLEH